VRRQTLIREDVADEGMKAVILFNRSHKTLTQHDTANLRFRTWSAMRISSPIARSSTSASVIEHTLCGAARTAPHESAHGTYDECSELYGVGLLPGVDRE